MQFIVIIKNLNITETYKINIFIKILKDQLIIFQIYYLILKVKIEVIAKDYVLVVLVIT